MFENKAQTFLPEHHKCSDYEGGGLALDFCLSDCYEKGRFLFLAIFRNKQNVLRNNLKFMSFFE